jgi:pimeloyl-ACP methyl ester carboxylesterase
MLNRLAKPLVRALPLPLALGLVTALATRTQRPPVAPMQQQALALARRLAFGARRKHVAWQWGDAGPLVLLVHGWNGRAAQLAPLASGLAAQGLRCVAIEVSGHGSSPGRRTTWAWFMRDLAALVQSLGEPVHTIVGHSAGGLAAMASRRLHGVHAARYVCICAPSHPFPPIRMLRARLDPPEAVVDSYRASIARQFGTPWSTLEAGDAWHGIGRGLLLFYDRADRFVDHAEGDRILAWCPGATLEKTASHGHTRVLGTPELQAAVSRFVLAA